MSRPKGSKNKKSRLIAPLLDKFVVANQSIYTATIRIAGRTYNATGTTLIEAIQNLKPDIKKGLGILTIEGNGRKIERILPANRTIQLFGETSHLTKEIVLKYLNTLFL